MNPAQSFSPQLSRAAHAKACSNVFLGLLAGLSAVTLGCREGIAVTLPEARHRVADLRVAFNRAADASNRAVMATTDESSAAFAREAGQSKRALKENLEKAGDLFRRAEFTDAARLLEDFRKHLAHYEVLDALVLELAVENTNLKAQQLSFGAEQQAADAFRDALGIAVKAAPPRTGCQFALQAGEAVLAIRDVQVLLAPHIAEADDAAMTRMEEEMSARESSARGRLQALGAVGGAGTTEPLTAAARALDRFVEVKGHIIKLSRRNSNVRSLSLSLFEKPPLIAACNADLDAIEDAMAKEGVKATR